MKTKISIEEVEKYLDMPLDRLKETLVISADMIIKENIVVSEKINSYSHKSDNQWTILDENQSVSSSWTVSCSSKDSSEEEIKKYIEKENHRILQVDFERSLPHSDASFRTLIKKIQDAICKNDTIMAYYNRENDDKAGFISALAGLLTPVLPLPAIAVAIAIIIRYGLTIICPKA